MNRHESPTGNTFIETAGDCWDTCYSARLKCPNGKFRKTANVRSKRNSNNRIVVTIIYNTKKGTKKVTGEIITSDYPDKDGNWEYEFVPYYWLKNGNAFD
jgi:hypothetical protein